MIHGGAKNRMATVFFYLNTVPGGGETGFPRVGGLEVMYVLFSHGMMA